jgi:hypothetical protein
MLPSYPLLSSENCLLISAHLELYTLWLNHGTQHGANRGCGSKILD